METDRIRESPKIAIIYLSAHEAEYNWPFENLKIGV